MHQRAITPSLATFASLLLLAAPAFAADWPTHRGPTANGNGDSGKPMVDDLLKARVVWFSEEKTPSAYPADLHTPHGFIQGGYAAPVVADGRVYLNYWVPSGKECDEEWVKKGLADARAGGLGEEVMRRKYALHADDVILCIDAATGKTLWKSVQKEKGFNFSKQGRGVGISVKGTPRLDVTVGGGKVFAVGSAGRIYALDAKTGSVVWESKLDKTSAIVESSLAACLKSKTLEAPKAGLTVCPLYVDGIVAVDDEDGLYGLDAGTGKRVWGPVAEWRHAGGSCPLKWTHEGRDYIMAEGTCIDPKTGKVLWAVKDATHVDESGCVALSGGYLVFAGGSRKGIAGLQCYKISATGATKLWGLGPEFAARQFASPAILNGHVYTRASTGGENKMICVELATGKVVAKAECPSSCNEIVAVDGRVFYEGSYAGPTMYDADPKNFRVLGQSGVLKALNFACSVPPAIVDGRMYYRSNTLGVMCLDLRQGSTAGKPVTECLSSIPKPAAARSTPSTPGKIPPGKAAPKTPDIDDERQGPSLKKHRPGVITSASTGAFE